MNNSKFLYRVYDLYRDGFRKMSLGRTLWLIIAVKLLIIFAVLKVFFFPDFLKMKVSDGDKAGYVSEELIRRAQF
jgi:hypothetical protein